MADREANTGQQMSAIERRRARSRDRHARLFAADPDYHKKKYRRDLQRNPDLNKQKYRRAIARNPDMNREKRTRSTVKKNDGAKAFKNPVAKKKRVVKPEAVLKRRERDKARYQQNKRAHIARVVRRQKARYATDKQYVLYKNLQSRMRYAVKSSNARACLRTMELIGCSPLRLAAHIESQFVAGMSWATRRLWHIDHIIPVSAFDLTTKEGQQAAFHYTNLRPLWAEDNQRKSSKPPAGQRRFKFGYIVMADKQREPGTTRRLGTERRRA